MASPRRRLGQDARRAELLAAAERLLRRDGPSVRVEDVVAAAKAAEGTFYTSSATWDDMLEEIRARQIAELERALARVLGRAEPASVLADVAAIAVDFIVGLGRLHEVLFHSVFTQARPMPANVRPPAQMAAILRRGHLAGVYAPCDPEPMGALIRAVMHETADRIAAGADRKRSLATLELALDRIVNADGGIPSHSRRKRP